MLVVVVVIVVGLKELKNGIHFKFVDGKFFSIIFRAHVQNLTRDSINIYIKYINIYTYL